MKLGDLGNSGDILNISIEKPIAGIFISGNVPYNAITDDLTARVYITSALDKLELSAHYKGKNGESTTLFNALKGSILAEFSQFQEGAVLSTDDGATFMTVKFYLPLTNGGSMAFDNDQTLEVSIKNDNSTGAFELHGIELPILSPDFLKFTKHSVQDGQTEKVFPLQNQEKIIIPTSAMSTDVVLEIRYTNGMVVRYGINELRSIANLSNDIVYNHKGIIVSGAGDHFILDVSTAESLQVLRTNTTAFDLVFQTSIVMDNLKEVKRVNEKLTDTTVNRKEVEALKQLG